MTEPRKITKVEQDLRRKFNRLKRTRNKIETKMWQTRIKIYDLMYHKKSEEDER